MSTRPSQFRVLIAGGGIAGLTLANALQHANIDYLLLEARDEFTPQLGASIGLGPNGSRILDQLGCYDEIMENTVPLDYTGSRRSDGRYIRPKTDGFRLVQARANYCMCFLDRQTVLRILAEHVKDVKKRLLNKRIVRADEHDRGVTVACADGSTYEGDVLVGADGVHSIVRKEMWRAVDLKSPGEISDEEKSSMFAEYRCIYAISTPIPGLPSREFAVTFKKDVTPIVITSRNERVYWFLIEKMPHVHRYGKIPRFAKADAEALVAKHLDIPLTPDGKVTVCDLWKNRVTYSIVPLEEAYYKHWSFGRFVCLGDSIHKMTPNMGAGGNSAIEGVAALANELHSMLDQNRNSVAPIPIENIRKALLSYQKTRHTRAFATVRASNYVTRFHALRGFLENLLAHYLMPFAGDLLVDLASDSWIGSMRIEYLPIPQRSLRGTMPFNPEQGYGKNESLLVRAVTATPFLAMCVIGLCLRMSQTSTPTPLFLAALMDYGTIYGLLLMESARRASILTPIQLYVFSPRHSSNFPNRR
jgi:2-polyprenyl-6-methoxyphenol hydroxylase-like FAD-dependent oxidoreductase